MIQSEPRFPDVQVVFNGRARLLLWCLLFLTVGVTSRFLLMDWPNFKPLTAMAIFSGFVFANRRSVTVLVVVTMLCSDAMLGFYELPIMLSVYASLLLSVALGAAVQVLARRHPGILGSVFSGTAVITASSVLASLLFFLFTNAAVWVAGWYPPTWAGLLQSYSAGLPFLRLTAAGDLGFSLLLFATWYAVQGTRAGQPATRCRAGHTSDVRSSFKRYPSPVGPE